MKERERVLDFNSFYLWHSGSEGVKPIQRKFLFYSLSLSLYSPPLPSFSRLSIPRARFFLGGILLFRQESLWESLMRMMGERVPSFLDISRTLLGLVCRFSLVDLVKC